MTTTPRGYIRERGGWLEAVIRLGDGKKRTVSTRLPVGQEEEAEAVLEAALLQLQEPAPGETTVKVWGKRWIEDRKARGKLEWTHEESHLEFFVYGPLGHLTLPQVTDVTMLDWARGLERTKGPRGKHPSPTYIRKITATARALFKEAVRRHLIERTPCVWEDSDLPELEANSRVTQGGYDAAAVGLLIYDPRIPEDRRVLYALEFLTGLRTGEAAARTWADWEPEYLGHLGRLTAATAWNTAHKVVKTTKTRVEKWIPVHPQLAAVLQAWKDEGWERFVGRPPTPEDLIVPAAKGGHRNNSYSWKAFTRDLVAVELPHQRHYETRATFISLAEGAGADPTMIARITHASLHGAKDLYRRVRLYWPKMCEAVACIEVPRPTEPETHFQTRSQGGSHSETPETESPASWAACGASEKRGVGDSKVAGPELTTPRWRGPFAPKALTTQANPGVRKCSPRPCSPRHNPSGLETFWRREVRQTVNRCVGFPEVRVVRMRPRSGRVQAVGLLQGSRSPDGNVQLLASRGAAEKA